MGRGILLEFGHEVEDLPSHILVASTCRGDVCWGYATRRRRKRHLRITRRQEAPVTSTPDGTFYRVEFDVNAAKDVGIDIQQVRASVEAAIAQVAGAASSASTNKAVWSV